jgi:hypothetical protein
MVEVAARIRRLPLGALLVKAGVASEADIQDALDEGNRKGEKLGEVALRRGWVSERKLAKLLADQWGLKSPDPAKLKSDPAALARIEAGVATELGGVPFCFDEDGLVVAVAEPKGDRFDSLRALLGNVTFVVVPPVILEELLDERRAMFESPRTPVELVGAWVAPAAARTRANQEAEGRDTDEAPLEETFEEERSATMEEVYVVEENHENGKPASYESIFAASTGTDSVVDHLRGLMGAVEALENELVESRQRAEAQEAELAELRRAHASDLETISGLGAELEDRRRRLEGLRSVVGELAVELDK